MHIYVYGLFVVGPIACLAYHKSIHYAMCQPLCPDFTVNNNIQYIVLTSNELQRHSPNLLAHSMANISGKMVLM